MLLRNSKSDDFDSFNTCVLEGFNTDNGNRNYRWAAGRQSPDQSESSVSGGDDMELVSYCYDPTWFRLFQARNDAFWETAGGDLAFLKDKSITEAIALASYGQVTEITNSDGERQLVCRYSNNKDWQVDREVYMQLSIRTGAVNWVNSELWWPDFKNKPVGMFENFDWVQRVRDLPVYGPHSTNRDEHLDFKDKRFYYGYKPARRGICRIEHEGKWYLGNVVRNGRGGWSSKYWSDNDWVVCGAFNDDGEFMEAEIYDRWLESDVERKSQYLVQVPGDDGSKWTDWTEWSECSATCGDAVRTRSRKCLDKDGNEIEPKTGVNCLPD